MSTLPAKEVMKKGRHTKRRKKSRERTAFFFLVGFFFLVVFLLDAERERESERSAREARRCESRVSKGEETNEEFHALG